MRIYMDAGPIDRSLAFNSVAWADEFRGLGFKMDTIEDYEMMRGGLSPKELSRDESSEYIIVLDAVSILARFYPAMINEIALQLDLMVEYGPP